MGLATATSPPDMTLGKETQRRREVFGYENPRGERERSQEVEWERKKVNEGEDGSRLDERARRSRSIALHSSISTLTL